MQNLRHSPSQSQRDKDGYSSMDNEEQAAYDNFYSNIRQQ